ncbi:hypothetical protein B5V02_19590 [Mesorhizobium kowhaii]|uniref:SPOR domain-containing protein n=1 Tax=Mesorhizobium kowhaii TaxID=1300272 RepID=A0A2W7C1M7_9HYPH|nr:hypothetical protein B5V02_19590 [Mesorhizobium kowhaii]
MKAAQGLKGDVRQHAAEQPPTYVVSLFEKPQWRTVLTTKDKAKALATAKEIGDKVRIEELTPKVKRR